MNEPKINIGIMFEPEIRFVFHGNYLFNGVSVKPEQVVRYDSDSGLIQWNGENYQELLFEPVNEENDFFELLEVTIGLNFHWERKETQCFQGSLRIIIENDKLTAVNILSIENYLISVISSEMSATASLELLKAHAVISRSWLLAQINKQKQIAHEGYKSVCETESEYIRWFDREDHLNFDVCADDHCQRYQGITRASTEKVKQAVKETRGETLLFDGIICDARFSKCCGGAFEEFQNCWEEVKYPYLQKQRDSKTITYLPDLQQEANAEQWIRTFPKAFCNTTDKNILSQVLNNYDQETADFYRWKVVYNREELGKLIYDRIGIDFGLIQKMIPVERGTSGRITKLKIIGDKATKIIGKELIIRKALSPSHLYSSAFVIDQEGDKFILTGAGWGHGVGLCQIGAAVMGEHGYSYKEILLHYYIGASLESLYD